MKRFVRAIAVAMALFGVVGFARAGVIDPTQPVAGISQQQLAEQWWQWALSAGAASNPLLDPDGRFAQVNNDGPVFFIAGNFGGASTRSFGVPAGKPLFFPMLNFIDIESPLFPPYCFDTNPADPLGCALGNISPLLDNPTNLHATLNGLDLLTFPSYRQTSNAFFGLVLSADNLLGAPADVYTSVSDGYWVALEGPAPGQYALNFGGATAGGFEVDVTANLRVPEPGTLGLVLLGALAAVGGFRSRTAASARRQA